VRARSLLPGALRRVARRVRSLGRRPEPSPAPGLPDGLERELLADVCRRAFGEEPLRTSYRHLSGFKTVGGAYRVYIETASGRPWTVFFKDCRYGRNDAPGLVDHPATLGPPEFAVYGSTDVEMRRFLPDVYHREEVTTGVGFRYLLEDVRGRYQKPTTPDELLEVVGNLHPLGRALRDWAIGTGEKRLIGYDHAMMRDLSDSATRTLKRYASDAPDGEAIRHVPVSRMAEVLARREFQEYVEPSGVHGDFNRASVLLHTDSPDRMKVVDWEWAGLGVPHIDLAILLEHADPQLVTRALRTYAEGDPSISPAEHERLFLWSRLATTLSNASILAAELLDGRRETRRDRSAYVRWLLRLATEAFEKL